MWTGEEVVVVVEGAMADAPSLRAGIVLLVAGHVCVTRGEGEAECRVLPG